MADEKTFTQADIDAAVVAATATLQSRLAEHEGAAATAAIQAQIDAATEPLTTQVADLQAQLDAATVAATAEKEAHDNLVAYLTQVAADQAEQAEVESRKVTRIAEAKEVAGLSDEYLADPANADRFAAMSDDAWTATVDGWKVIREAAGVVETAPLPKKTALVASAGEGAGSGAPTSVLRGVIGARHERAVDLGSLTR